MAFHALADYQNHVIGWLQWEQSSLELGPCTISANLDVIWGMSVKIAGTLVHELIHACGRFNHGAEFAADRLPAWARRIMVKLGLPCTHK